MIDSGGHSGVLCLGQCSDGPSNGCGFEGIPVRLFTLFSTGQPFNPVNIQRARFQQKRICSVFGFQVQWGDLL